MQPNPRVQSQSNDQAEGLGRSGSAGKARPMRAAAFAVLVACALGVGASSAQEPPALKEAPGSPASAQAGPETKRPAPVPASPTARRVSEPRFAVAGQTIGVSKRGDLDTLRSRSKLDLKSPQERSSETKGVSRVVKGPLISSGVTRSQFSYDEKGVLQGADIDISAEQAPAVFARLVKGSTKVQGKDGLFRRGDTYARLIGAEDKSANAPARIELMSASLMKTRTTAEDFGMNLLIFLVMVASALLVLWLAVKLLCQPARALWRLVTPAKRRMPATRLTGSPNITAPVRPPTATVAHRDLTSDSGPSTSYAAPVAFAAGATVAAAASTAFMASHDDDMAPTHPQINPVNGLPMMDAVHDVHGNTYGTTNVDDLNNGWVDDSYSSGSYQQDFGGHQDFGGYQDFGGGQNFGSNEF